MKASEECKYEKATWIRFLPWYKEPFGFLNHSVKEDSSGTSKRVTPSRNSVMAYRTSTQKGCCTSRELFCPHPLFCTFWPVAPSPVGGGGGAVPAQALQGKGLIKFSLDAMSGRHCRPTNPKTQAHQPKGGLEIAEESEGFRWSTKRISCVLQFSVKNRGQSPFAVFFSPLQTPEPLFWHLFVVSIFFSNVQMVHREKLCEKKPEMGL